MKKRLIILILYAIAMAYVEAMVVVYLRRLIPVSEWSFISSYNQLCDFIRKAGIMWSEQTREFATIVMLVCISFLFGSNKKERIAGFLISFGIWDIFYYLFLYIWLKWPENLLAWDVLFLIPVPWISPVIVPVVISAIMIITGSCLLFNSSIKRKKEN